MKFRKLYDWESEVTLVSKKFNNGDWDYWLVLQTTNMHEATGEEDLDKYYVSVLAVSPEAAGEENLKRAASTIDQDVSEMSEMDKVQGLVEYGVFATLATFQGNNRRKVEQEAREEAEKINMLFGFYMDKAGNRIGNDGWDFISGNTGF